MSRTYSTRRSAVLGIGTIAGGALAAAFIGLGTAVAYADDALAPDGYSDLFGGGNLPQATDDASLDAQLFDQNPGYAASFDQAVDTFESSDDHGMIDLVNSIDPSAFTTQFDPDIAGTLANGGFLVPDDTLGYIATEMDFFLLNPTGLDPALLAPVIDTLVASPPF